MEAQLKTQNLRGLTTAWYEAGQPGKPVLLFLHGFPDTAEIWEKQIAHFAKDYHVIAPNVRGAKPSAHSDNLQRYTLDSLTLDWLELLQTIDPTKKIPIYCVGHDLGGTQAFRLAAHLPSRMRGLVIINSLPIEQFTRRVLREPRQLLKSWYMGVFANPLLAAPVARLFPQRILRAAYDKGRLPADNRPAIAQAISGVKHPIRLYSAFSKELVRSLRAKPGNRIKTPTLILAGAKDPFLNIPRTDDFARWTETFTIRILPGGHWLQRDYSEQINDLMTEFFACQGH